ncbi:MAG TPA: PDZ domain-containing protein [Pirellulaceae bacterium]|jgi:serine protease Do|nr:PDZ domain-containing protein [Pirellulaceae bacterium]
MLRSAGLATLSFVIALALAAPPAFAAQPGAPRSVAAPEGELAGEAEGEPPGVSIEEDALASLQRATRQALAKAGPSMAALVRLPKGRRQAFGQDASEVDLDPQAFAAAVAIDDRGTLLTTYAAIGDPEQFDYFVVRDAAARLIPVQLLAADPWYDLATLRATGAWRPVEKSLDHDPQKGDYAIALCNPYGLARDGELTAAWTMIGGLRRRPATPSGVIPPSKTQTVHQFANLLYVDLKATPGVEGGALFDLQGRMVGLLTGMAASDGEGAGSLAIPCDEPFWAAVDALREGRRPEYGFLGVAPRALGSRGVSLEQVEDASPAKRAGLRPDDVVIAVDGVPIDVPQDLFREIGKRPARSEVELSVIRSSRFSAAEEPFEVSVRLSKRAVDTRRPQYATAPEPSWRGMTVDDLSALSLDSFHERKHLIGPRTCLAVATVEPDSPAWKAGLRPGALIERIDGVAVETPAEFYEIANARPGVVPLQELPLGEGPKTFRVAPPKEAPAAP